MGLFSELKRRNVFRATAAYLVLSWLILQVVSVVLPALHAPDWILSVTVILLGVGFIFTLVFSWAFALTPSGLRREREVDVTPEERAETARKLDLTVIVMLVVAMLTALGLHFVAPPKESVASLPASGEPSVAVLPFVNMSGVADNEYFSDGLTETLLHMLAQVDGLKVAARTSSFAFKGRDHDIREIATTLGVANVLEGSVQRSGNRIRVTAQLIDAGDGSHIWSENYDRELDDVFAIQDEIAISVANRLTSALIAESEVGTSTTSNTQAYDLYLRGITQQKIFSWESLEHAEAFLRSAIAIDPGFIDARRELAHTLWQQWETGLGDIATYREAIDILDRLLEDAPADVLARGMRLRMLIADPEDVGEKVSWADITDDLELLVAQAPNEPLLYQYLSIALGVEGDVEAALAVNDKALALDPLDADLYDWRSRILMRKLRIEEGEPVELINEVRAALHRAIELNPGNASQMIRLADFEFDYGEIDRFFETYLRAIETDPADPEIPAELAVMLYQVKAFDLGDRYAELARSIDSTAAVNHKPPVVRAFMEQDFEKSQELAAAVLRDNVRNRQGTRSVSEFVFMVSTHIIGADAEARDFFLEHIATTGCDREAGEAELLASFEDCMTLLVLDTGGEVDAGQRAFVERLVDIREREEPGFMEKNYLPMVRIMLGERIAPVFRDIEDYPRYDFLFRVEQELRIPAFHDAAADPVVQERLAAIRQLEQDIKAVAERMLGPVGDAG